MSSVSKFPGFSSSPVLEHNSTSGILALWYAQSNQTSLPLLVFDPSACGCSDRVAAARQAPAAEAAPAPSQPPPAAPQKLSREELDNKLRGCLEEYFSARDKSEVSQTVKELQDKTEAAQIFEQVPLVAVGKMRGVDWGAITVSRTPHPNLFTSLTSLETLLGRHQIHALIVQLSTPSMSSSNVQAQGTVCTVTFP